MSWVFPTDACRVRAPEPAGRLPGVLDMLLGADSLRTSNKNLNSLPKDRDGAHRR